MLHSRAQNYSWQLVRPHSSFVQFFRELSRCRTVSDVKEKVLPQITYLNILKGWKLRASV